YPHPIPPDIRTPPEVAMTLATSTNTSPLTHTRAVLARGTALAGALYVSAWITGLLAGPTAPAGTASDASVHSFYVEHSGAALVQSLLVHGMAGLALALLALGTARHSAATRSGSSRVTRAAGLAAAVVSLGQAGLGVAAAWRPETASAAQSATLFHSINIADSIKLVLLAGFVAAASTALRHCDRPARIPGWIALILVPLLPVGGAAFLVSNAVLTGLLTVSLPLLLLWTLTVSVSVLRRR
ncbi:MAG: hypothetical protein ACTHJJ_03490, partial [Intrasporangium sp.]|uniref:hypothetical protein n=1 Tax=Intrasporangium sp. TaxID=1925024 RepID=UPI003F815C18